jgi:two-component system, NtrC family, response regulator HydG
MSGQQPLLVIVDDEQGILDVVSRFAERLGFDVAVCARGREAISLLQTRRPDVMLVDLRMPDVGGLDVLRAIRDVDAHCQAVLMTGYASVDTAVEAVKLGAMDYLTKPLDFGRLEQLLSGVREEIERRRSVLSLEGDLARHLEFCGMIGRGPRMQDLFGLIRRLAPHVRLALISGETGTGKELVARALHTIGPRRDRRFIAVNCSAVHDTVFESELFGHVRGGFLGATDNKPGLFELAEGGTLFLDEIGGLPLTAQAKLLRVLETGEVSRIGSLDSKNVDVHVLAATNRELRTEVAAGRFRGDLYYRLNIVEVKLPPLRDRREDIPYLTASFVREIGERLQKPLRGLTPGAEALLTDSPWEGNVRELRNVIERACILADGEFVTERELSVSLPPIVTMSPPPAASAAATVAAPAVEKADSDLLVNVERDHIQRALVRTGGNKKAAAQMLGLSRRALYRRLERLDLSGTISRRRQSMMLGA